MDWILDNLQLILAIAGAIAYWLNARKKEQAGEPADYDGDGEPDTQPQDARSLREQDPTLLHDENTRRIQEEIRRKIAERQSGGPVGAGRPTVQPAAMPSPAAREVAPAPNPPPVPVGPAVARRREIEGSPYAMEETRRAAEEREAAVLASQRELAEQLAALKQRRAESGRSARSLRESQETALATAVAGQARTGDDTSWLSDLRNARSLRKAVVLREVLGTPVGLR
jgi:hypothetical protein